VGGWSQHRHTRASQNEPTSADSPAVFLQVREADAKLFASHPDGEMEQLLDRGPRLRGGAGGGASAAAAPACDIKASVT